MLSCPICDKPTDAKYRPFCSRRCADVDLGKWLTESYSLPSEEVDESEIPEDDSDQPGTTLH